MLLKFVASVCVCVGGWWGNHTSTAIIALVFSSPSYIIIFFFFNEVFLMPYNSKCRTCLILCYLAPACTDFLSPAIICNKKIPFSSLGELSRMVLIREGLLERGEFLLPFFVR